MNAQKIREICQRKRIKFNRKTISHLGYNITHETCKCCGKSKRISQFFKNSDNVTGRSTTCKECETMAKTDQYIMFELARAPYIEPHQKMFGCSTPQEPEYIADAWRRAMKNRRFDEPGMVVKYKKPCIKHLRLA